MKRQVISLLVALLIVTTGSAAEETKAVRVTFYHTSDIHEHSVPLPRIAGYVAARKKENANVLLVDTGDWCNKGDLTELNTRGEAIAAMMSACKYDASIAGNHDHSFGTKRLAELIDRFSLPIVAANCVWQDDTKPKNVAPYRIFKLDGVTVAVLGTATPIASQRTDTLFKDLPMVESLRGVVAQLKEDADIIVVLTHIGTPADEKLAQALPDVDIIFGGHDHRLFQTLTLAPNTDTVIQHSGSNGKHIGELTITWDGKRIVDRKLRVLEVTDTMPQSVPVAAQREKYVSAATTTDVPAAVK